jgi:DNA-binding MarR family transcriptional regulator
MTDRTATSEIKRATRRRKLSSADYEKEAELRSALHAYMRTSERVMRKHGLTTERFQLLLLLKVAAQRGDGDKTVSSLSTSLHVAVSTATQLVRRAENLQLVRREISRTDARVRYLHLTEEGERRLAATMVELQDDRFRLLSLSP